MLWSRCSRRAATATAAAPRFDTPLRIATQRATRLGCLGGTSSLTSVLHRVSAAAATPPADPSSSPASSADASAKPNDSTADEQARVASKTHGDGVLWWSVVERQQNLFAAAHSLADGAAAAITLSCVNIVHVEGVVEKVFCGHFATHAAGVKGEAVPGRRTVAVMAPQSPAFPSVLLWLRVEDTDVAAASTSSTEAATAASATSVTCLLGVRCRLSPEVVEARWQATELSRRRARRAASLSSESEESPAEEETTHNNSSSGEAGTASGKTEAKLRCVKAWAAAAFLKRRVIVSGQLRMEELYDGDLEKVVVVPMVEVAADSLMDGVKAIV